jgi:cellulose synthase/poly-beta-1,6-N-acetylglucosamine synthase-like glycosyltransferase
MTLSVIVCTHQRPQDLERCLAGLAAHAAAAEVIVVDSASKPAVAPAVEAFNDRLPRLRYVYVEQPGLSLARNAGIAAATGEIVAFLDDDAVPEAGWPDAIKDAFAAPGVGCVGGACRPAFAADRPRWLSDRLLQLAGITRFGTERREPRSSAEWPFGANMAFRREALADAGEFSTALGRRGRVLLSGEDSNMVARVLACGWRVLLEPRAVVAHTVAAERCESGYWWRRLWWNGIGRAVAPSPVITVRLLVAVPVRLALFVLSRDRFFLYRLAESAGYLAALTGLARSA